ncbi:CobW/HypB/UreG, nucleotide-binding domain-containing protein [Schizophyllum commune]
MFDDEDEIPTLIEHEVPPALDDTSALANKRVPLTIICGFLGAGKSTLLKRILTEKHGYRIAVIMNEFGDTADIEAKAINVSSPDDPAAQSEEFLELANGCLCCSIKDAGLAAIEKLMERKGAFDHILLETTGLADPGPIASMIWHNEEYALGLGKDIALDGVICVVDAVFGKQQMEEDSSSDDSELGESLRQIAGSDIILLNKVDLVSPETLATTEDLITKVNPGALVYRTVRGQIDLGKLMGIRAYGSAPVIAEEDEDVSPSDAPKTKSDGPITHTGSVAHSGGADAHEHGPNCNHDHDHDPNTPHAHSHPHSTHYEVRGISSLRVNVPPLTPEALHDLDEWVREVLWEGRLPESLKDPLPESSKEPLPESSKQGRLPGEGAEVQDASAAGPSLSAAHAPQTVADSNATAASPSKTDPLLVLRCKGLFVTTTGERYVLQGVRNMYDLFKAEEDAASKDDVSKKDDGGSKKADDVSKKDDDVSKKDDDVSKKDGDLTGVPKEGKLVLIGKGLGEDVRRSLERLFWGGKDTKTRSK